MATKNYLNYFCILFISLCFIKVTFAQENARDWFQKGTKASNPDDKIRYYLKSIELDPNLIEAHYNLAYVYKNKNEYEKALKALNEALNLCGEETDEALRLSIFYELGICYKRIENYSKSVDMLESAKKLARDEQIRIHILYELGRVALLVKDFDKALAQFNEGIQIDGKNETLFREAIEKARKEKLLNSLYNEGMTLLQQRKYHQAFEVFSKINELEPNYQDTNIKLVEAQNQIQNKSDLTSGKSAEELLKEANALYFSNNYEQALEKYKLAINISPFNSKCYYNMGRCYEKLQDNQMAIAAYQKALSVKSNFKEASIALSRLGGKPLDQEVKDASFIRANRYFFQKNYDEAITSYSNYLKKDPLNFQAQFNIAFCYEQKGELKPAIEHYQKALKIDDGSVEASQGLARVKEKQEEDHLIALKRQIEKDLEYERFSLANSKVKQYLKFNPNDTWALDKARVINHALETQKEAETSRELLAEQVNLDNTTDQTQNESMTNVSSSPDSTTKVQSEPEPTEENSQVIIYVIAGLIIILIGFIGLMSKKWIARKLASGKRITDTSVHSFLTDCFSKKRTGIVTVKSNREPGLNIKGKIRIKDGNIVDAKCGNLASIDALSRLLAIDIPENLIFQEIQIPPSGNIRQATLPLLMQWKNGKEKA